MIRRGFIKAADHRGQIAATHADPDKFDSENAIEM